MIINVDCDGVILSNRLEELLIQYSTKNRLSMEESSSIWDWYNKLVNSSHLKRNDPFLKYLNQLKEMGHSINLWTNRNYELHESTLRELGPFTSIFNDFLYYNGSKHRSQVEGIVIDNNSKYLHCGEKGSVLFPTFI